MESKTVHRTLPPGLSDSTTRVGDEPLAPHQPTRLDAHLVMNVLNQMAAEDFHDRGVEDPALFALSGYLQEVFRQQISPRSTLADGARLLETHLNLYSLVHDSKIELSISMNEKMADRPAEHRLFQLADCLLAAIQPKFGGRWRMHFALEVDGDVPSAMRIMVDLQAMAGETQGIDMPAAQLGLAGIEHADCPHITKVVWTQHQPTDLRLECTVLPIV